MKAAWIHEFHGDLQSLSDHQSSVISVSIHYKIGNSWVVGDGVTVANDALDNALASSVPQKVGKQKRYLFSVPDVNVMVDVTFNNFPKAPTLSSVRTFIDKTRDHSQHRFDAHHDSLTSCKNRKSFNRALRYAFDSMVASAPAQTSSLGGAGVRSVSLVTLDVDYFKRINDSRGHDYGDLVLKGFAWLLEEQCEKASRDFADVDFSLFRLGGEEFNILVVGELDERDLLAWIESVREVVQTSYVPSAAQLQTMERDAGTAIAAPIEGERRITASFGVSRFTGAVSAEDIGQVAGRLKTQADKALYSAKNSGRNRVRYFPDILKRYGRVIENDKAAGAVVIDIGSEVGVVPGREFFIVPERYAGDIDYITDDGRSQRKLGTFPRIKIAKVVAFDVQSEISFCSITDHRTGTEIAPGCLLESIPLGLFGGLATPHGTAGVPGDIDGRKALQAKLQNLPQESVRVFALRIDSIAEIEKKHGPVRVNELLAAVYAVMARVLPAPAKIVQTEVGQFGAALSVDDQSVGGVIQQLVTGLRTVCGDVANFSLGVFDNSALQSVAETSYSLDMSHAYDYAVIASAAAESNSSAAFEFDSPRKVLSAREASGAHEQVIADYKKFREIGVISAALDNAVGIAYFAAGNIAESSAAFRGALELDGSETVVRSNYAITQFVLGKYVEAYQQMSLASIGKPDDLPSQGLLGLYAIAAYESSKKLGEPQQDQVQLLFERALSSSSHMFVKEERVRSSYDEWRSSQGAYAEDDPRKAP